MVSSCPASAARPWAYHGYEVPASYHNSVDKLFDYRPNLIGNRGTPQVPKFSWYKYFQVLEVLNYVYMHTQYVLSSAWKYMF